MPSAESVFRELNARLDLPARRRAELLRELRADFDDLVGTLVAEGLSPEAAQARALQMLAPTEEEAGTLSGLHRSGYARLVGAIQPRWVRVLERTGIGAMAALAVFAPTWALARGSGLPLLALAALGGVAVLVVVNLAWQAFRIVVRGDATAADLVRAGTVQAGLVVLTLTTGAGAVATEVYMAASAWERAGEIGVQAVVGVLMVSADTAALALGLTTLAVFGALALVQWHLSAKNLEEELDALLSPLTHPDRSD